MKKLMLLSLIVVVAAFSFGKASAQIELTDNLSITGFLDMSSVLEETGEETALSLSFDQFEIDFLFDYGSVTAQADLNYVGALEKGEDIVVLEQGFVTYTLPESILPGASITTGRFLSSLGWETAEPTGLYQFSFSEGIPYPGYQNGVAVSVQPVEQVGIYAAVLSSVWDENETDLKKPGIETQLSLMPVEQITAKVGFAFEDTGDFTQSELNAWASFVQGPITVAGEIDLLQNWFVKDKSGIHFLGMVNVSLADMISAPVGATVRFSGIKFEEEDASTEITFSPSFAATDNWLLLAEVKRLIDKEVTLFAVESLFTF